MAQSSKKKKKKSNRLEKSDQAGGIVLGAAGIVILGVLGFGWWWLQSHKIAYDEATNCPLKGPIAVHAMLIDRSDPITQQQSQQIEQYFDRIMKSAKFGEKYDVYTIEGNNTDSLEPILAVCSPGRGADANQLYENPERIQKRFESQFVDVLRRSIQTLLEPSQRDNSPILESIKAVGVTSFGPYKRGDVAMNLTIVSDMIQHTSSYSQYLDQGDVEDLLKKPVWRSLQANLKGAQVHILYVLRNGIIKATKKPIQTRGHQLFWEQVILANSGEITEFDPI